jgi:glycosyltransferase involved in cell wall biosynthesis
MKKLLFVSPCYNEEDNIEILYSKYTEIKRTHPHLNFEYLFIDNDSNDNTLKKLKHFASLDKSLKIIVNEKNFGHIKSPYYAMLQSNSDAVVLLASDLQDPPEIVPEFIKAWELGYKVIVGIKGKSKENFILFAIRKLYYKILDNISLTPQIKNFTGFGLYDKKFIDVLKSLKEPYPYFRGLVTEFGFSFYKIQFKQPKRLHGKTKNNLISLYDTGMLGLTSQSIAPIRIASFLGFLISLISFITGIFYFVYKLFYWSYFQLGVAPIVIGFFFFFGIQMFIIGLIGEYLISISHYIKNRPLVIEKERINF